MPASADALQLIVHVCSLETDMADAEDILGGHCRHVERELTGLPVKPFSIPMMLGIANFSIKDETGALPSGLLSLLFSILIAFFSFIYALIFYIFFKGNASAFL